MHGKSKLAERKLCVNVNPREKMFHFFLFTCFVLRKLGHEIVPCVLQFCKELKIKIFWQRRLYHWITKSEYFNLKQKEDKKEKIFIPRMRISQLFFTVVVSKDNIYLLVNHCFYNFKDFRH